MEWTAIATVLCERSDRPTVVIDRMGRIRLVNRAMETVLGRPRHELIGAAWSRTCTPSDRRAATRRWFADALRGAIARVTSHAATPSGTLVELQFDLALVGKGAKQGLIAVATEWRALHGDRIRAASDRDYAIALQSPFGQLVALHIDGESAPYVPGASCFHTLHGRERPCDDCPAVTTREPWPRHRVRVREGADHGFEVLSASKRDEDVGRISARALSEEMLDAIHAIRIGTLAERAGLSPREREVLRMLLLGRSTQEIGDAVGIAERTVKYHQANVLRKVGAESRVDLMRLLF